MHPGRSAAFVGLALLLAPAMGASDIDSPEPALAGLPWTTLMAAMDGPVGEVIPASRAAGLPPTIQDGLGPGSALQLGVDGIQYVCTAAFLLRDPLTATYYLSTAGHCLVRDASDPEPVSGKDTPEKAKNRVDICVAGCINNGLGLGTYVSLQARGMYHPVAYAESGGIGQDFGIVELPADLHDVLRPEMPQWGGPVGLGGGNLGDLVAHYGHGSLLVPGVVALVTRTPADQGRLAMHAGSDEESFSALGHATGGDSGSGASLAVTDAAGLARGTEALGVVTHAIVYAGAPLMSGTLLSHGIAMVERGLGIRLELVAEGDPLTAVATGPPPGSPAEIAIVRPGPGATVRPVGGAIEMGGNAAFGPGGNSTRIEVAVDDPTYGFESRLPVLGNATWTATWYPGSAAAGVHTLRARLVAADGEVLDETNQTFRLDRTPSRSSSSSPPPAPSPTGTGQPAPRATTAPAGDAEAAASGAGGPVTIEVPALPALQIGRAHV